MALTDFRKFHEPVVCPQCLINSFHRNPLYSADPRIKQINRKKTLRDNPTLDIY
jgi:hypothetical protein